MAKQLTREQIHFAITLAERHGLNIPFDILHEYDFGKKFIDLFAYNPDENDMSGFRRVDTIISYLYYDKDQRHLQFKLELEREDVAFMVSVISLYKFGGEIPREDLSDRDPELSAYGKLEEELWEC